jgi:flagellar biosynthetic protein FlhB
VANDKTEKATPKKRGEARGKGQVVKSTDVNTAVVLTATIAALSIFGPKLMHQMEQIVTTGLKQSGDTSLTTPSGIQELTIWGIKSLLITLGPILGIAMGAGLISNVMQVKFKFSLHSLKPSLTKLNPGPGFKRLFSKNAVMEAVKATAKTCVVGFAAYLALKPELPRLGSMIGLSPSALAGTVGSMVMTIATRVLLAFFLLAVADYAWQKRQFENKMKMSKDDVKQEHKQSELSPEVRRTIRRRQMEGARKRMMAAVPTADVIITNPTHFAVALKYDGKKPAPEVIAKGADLVAAAIRRIAAENDIPVLSNPPLARALYAEVEIGRQIPDEFFVAVAEVLAFVFRTAGRRRRAS